MEMIRHGVRALFLGAAIAISGCNATVKIDQKVSAGIPRTIAFLPTEYPSAIKRERVDYLRQAALNELRGDGFVILEDKIVSRICSSAICPERKQLKERFGVESFVTLKLETASKNNFIAGYFSVISGTLVVEDVNRAVLISVEDSAQDRGGLLFNSGQILQGLASSAESTGEEGFNRLSERFVKSLIAKLPRPVSDGLADSAVRIALDSVKITPVGPALFKICALGTPGNSAYFVLDRRHATLREETKGMYCGNFLLEGNVSLTSTLAVELRSPFGNNVQLKVAVDPFIACNLEGLILSSTSETHNAEGAKLQIACSPTLSAKECETRTRACTSGRLLVYRGAKDTGPYIRAGSVPTNSAFIEPKDRLSRIYAVVAESQNGAQSTPVTVKFGEETSDAAH